MTTRDPKTPELLRSLAGECVSLSKDFEPFVPTRHRGAIESLSVLRGLESLTAKSLPAAPGPAPAASAPAPAAAPAAQPAPIAAVSTSRGEYAPALKDPSLVQALLALRAAAGRAAAAAPAKSAPTAPAAAPQLEGFRPSAPPDVASAKPKPSPLSRRSVGPFQTILRTPS